MRVLLVDAYDEPELADQVAATLAANGHQVERLALSTSEYAAYMSEAEHRAYETDQPLLDETMQRSAAMVSSADALVFVYPTTLFGVPPVLKNWFERVLVLGVAFVFDDKQRIRPGLTNVRRLAVATTTPHSRRDTWRARDLGYRTIMRTLRLNCHPLCRRTFVRLPGDMEVAKRAQTLDRRFRRW